MSIPTTRDTLCEFGLSYMSSTMELAYTIMNGDISSIIVEVSSPLYLDAKGSETPMEECKFRHHNSLGG
jgi:hypothetical protein